MAPDVPGGSERGDPEGKDVVEQATTEIQYESGHITPHYTGRGCGTGDTPLGPCQRGGRWFESTAAHHSFRVRSGHITPRRGCPGSAPGMSHTGPGPITPLRPDNTTVSTPEPQRSTGGHAQSRLADRLRSHRQPFPWLSRDSRHWRTGRRCRTQPSASLSGQGAHGSSCQVHQRPLDPNGIVPPIPGSRRAPGSCHSHRLARLPAACALAPSPQSTSH